MSVHRQARPKLDPRRGWRIEAADRADPQPGHSPGWPHLDRHGNCLCKARCCLGPGGCRCPRCSGQSHRHQEVAA